MISLSVLGLDFGFGVGATDIFTTLTGSMAGIWDGKVDGLLNPAAYWVVYGTRSLFLGLGFYTTVQYPLAGLFVGYGVDRLLVSHKERAGRAIAVIHVRYSPYFAFN